MIHEFRKDGFILSTDKQLLQFNVIHDFLKTSYWSPGIPLDVVKRAAEGSIAFGIYKESGEQVGYARVISDCATFAYLADVFVLETERGRGLSKWLMECLFQLPELQGLRRWSLATRDAHGLYAQFGFTPLDNPDIMMQIARPNIYMEMKEANGK
ncbi:GNAT family N-acetyltransferase [Emticicia sp. 21SJ11W-3]|uniref:GNAT family N-acetyltransferase n=1 Tax=Emticicia sp. 21SJ11W-3 TaxID=2916755 RepID=UPI00209C89CB|nr:GNAT family N-acetyltransferase [Emticicia sp. 21SJ11W-3]UTA67788.1 GNAT family N-acetyltransferase [Emticicia sp. 21SJ11W-3]